MALPIQRIHQQFRIAGAVYRFVDAACVVGGLAVASRLAGAGHVDATLAAFAAVAVFCLVAEFSGMYRSWRGVSAEREAFCTLVTWGLSFLILAAFGFTSGRMSELPRPLLWGWLAITPLFILGAHAVLRQLQRSIWCRGKNTQTAAIVGATNLGIQLGRNLCETPELGLKLAGFYDDRPDARTTEMPPGLPARIGAINDLIADAKAGLVNRIYITFPMRAEDRIRGVLSELADTTASVYIVPDFFVFQLLHSRWTDINGLPAVSVFENPLYGVDGLSKRIFDLVVGSAALLLSSAPMAVIAIAIKVTSRGPVFFRQTRYGLDGRQFRVWKFRTMRVLENGPQVTQATKRDPRVTPLGAILRRTSLDELPQLFNVVAGSMSLVGPRPHATAHNEQYRKLIEGYMLRHKIKPGVTGLAQVRGYRGETDTLEKMQKRVDSDHEYIREWSLWLDVKILFRTVLVVLSRQNAY